MLIINNWRRVIEYRININTHFSNTLLQKEKKKERNAQGPKLEWTLQKEVSSSPDILVVLGDRVVKLAFPCPVKDGDKVLHGDPGLEPIPFRGTLWKNPAHF